MTKLFALVLTWGLISTSAIATEGHFPVPDNWDTDAGYGFKLICKPSALPQTTADRDPVQSIAVSLEHHDSTHDYRILITHEHYTGKRSPRVGVAGAYYADKIDAEYVDDPKPLWNWVWYGRRKANPDLYMTGIIIRDLNPGKLEWTYHEYLKKFSSQNYSQQITEASC